MWVRLAAWWNVSSSRWDRSDKTREPLGLKNNVVVLNEVAGEDLRMVRGSRKSILRSRIQAHLGSSVSIISLCCVPERMSALAGHS